MALEKKYGERIRFIVVDVNTEQGYKLAEDYKIRFLPTMLFLDQKGELVKRHEGWIDGAVLEDQLVTLLDREGKEWRGGRKHRSILFCLLPGNIIF